MTCQNGGSPNAVCSMCDCPPGFTGSSCQTDIDECSSLPCLNGGICSDGINSFTCQCQLGYTGSTCESSINDCSPNPCQNGGICADGLNSFTCNCQNGFAGATCGELLVIT